MANGHPLAGLTIVITRPRDQATQLTQGIEQAGGTALLYPLLEIAEIQDKQALREQLSRLAQFELAIFISPNAVRYGLAAIRAASLLNHATNPLLPLQDGGSLRIATVGQGSARALREAGVADIIAPTDRFDSEGLLALPELKDVSGKRVLIFRGDGGRELLGDTLKARGATVEYAACYRRIKPQQEVQALLNPLPDAITVTSSEALSHLDQMLADAPSGAVRAIQLFVQHARIAELARQLGWQQVLQTASGDEGLLAGLLDWASRSR